MATIPSLVAMASRGICAIEGPVSFKEKWLQDDKTANFRTILFSPKGNYLAWRSDRSIEIVKCSDWGNVVTLQSKGVKGMLFSPSDTYFVTWEIFIMNSQQPKGKPNMHLYKTSTGQLLHSFTQKQQTGWEPQWTQDEKLFTVQDNTRILMYENDNFERYTHQLVGDKVKSYKLAPTQQGPPYYIAIFTLGNSGQPSAWKVYKYPDLQPTQCVASKSSFQSDRATFYWNRRGTNLLIMTHSDVDKTGSSYYGKQTLSYADSKGNANNVVFSKEGPIHCVSWNPGSWNEWVGVYGHAPAKATLFNAKCEPLYEFGTGSWNTVQFSLDGSKLFFGGFGNIGSGAVDVWDPRGFKKLGSFIAQDTTYVQWDPRSECIVTATTYPRLTVSNGFKVWHYTGVLMRKRPFEEHLLAIQWQSGNFPKSELSTTIPKAIEDTEAKPSSQPYRPPGAAARPVVSFSFHNQEAPHKPGANATPSKQAIKQKEKREARKVKKAEQKVGDTMEAPKSDCSKQVFVSTGDPEKDKKIKNLNKKLSDIQKLKQMRSEGKQLEINQKAKIESEPTLLKELEQLKL